MSELGLPDSQQEPQGEQGLPDSERETQRFAPADQLTCYYDQPAEPANVHVEVRVAGRLDEGALHESVRAVLAAEPGIRARRARTSGWRSSYSWEVPAASDADPVQVTAHADQPGLDAQRDAFLSLAVPLDSSPPLRFLLTSGPGADCLILSAHHARFDGLSCLRLLRSVASEYGARTERAGAQDGPAGATAGQDAAGTVPALAPPARAPRSGAGRIVRIAPGPGHAVAGPLPGYGAHLMSWDGLAVADRLRACGASVNDLLISALILAVSDWNEGRVAPRRGRAGLTRITMPVGDQAQADQDGRWANTSRLTAVTARVGSTTQPGDLLGEVARQTRRAKEHHGPQLDLASRILAGAPVPVAAKQFALRAALRTAGPLICDTSLVSNLGQVEAPAFGALPATEVWFSTSAHMPRGLSLGAITADGRLRLTFRYRRALFSASDAAEFAVLYGKALDRFRAPEAVLT